MNDRKNRHEIFKTLLKQIPTPGKTAFNDAVSRIDWLVNNLHCGRATARQWCMEKPVRVIPEAKLKIMQEKLGATVVSEGGDSDVRCGCCGYMTYHREHLACIRAAQSQSQAGLHEDVKKRLQEIMDLLHTKTTVRKT